MMKVRDLMVKLIDLNPNADLKVIVNNMVEEFTITTSGDLDCDGTSREKTEEVYFYVDRSNYNISETQKV